DHHPQDGGFAIVEHDWQSILPSAKTQGPLLVLQPQRRDERLLGDLDPADALHAPLALLLTLEELALAGDVAAVALGDHVLAPGLDGLTGDDAPADGGLDGHVEELAGDELAEPGRRLAAVSGSLVAVGGLCAGVGGDA